MLQIIRRWFIFHLPMAEASESDESLSIRCPQCRQRFSVDGSLLNRMVECGGCDTRFRINDEVIVRSRKIYPGERNDPELQRFQRVPLSASAPEGMRTANYAEFNHPERLGPASPQRIIAGIIGVGLMVLVALILIFSGSPGGSFYAMTMQSKLVIAAFVSLVGVALLIYANRNSRIKGGAAGLLMAAGLISIPFVFRDGSDPADAGKTLDNSRAEPLFPEEDKDLHQLLRERFSTKPLENEQEKMEEMGAGKKAYGVYLEDMDQSNLYISRDYLIRETEAGPSSHPYPRDEGNYLMILTGVSKDFPELAEIAGKLGRTSERYPEIGVIVVSVDNQQFVAGSADKLNDKQDPAFYELNQRELASIDIDRVRRAVERLSDAEPAIYRTDISRQMSDILKKPGINFHKELAAALMKWTDDSVAAGESALIALKGLMAAGDPVPESLVALLLKEKETRAIPLVAELWTKNPSIWDSYLAKFGAAAEPVVSPHLSDKEAPLRRSSISILEQIGSRKNLGALRQMTSDKDPEVRVLAVRAVNAIEGR